jgi:hypothetical protein
MENVREDWRKLHNQELHSTTISSPDIIRWNKSMRMRWAGHVAGVGRGRIHIELEWRKLIIETALKDYTYIRG